MPGREQGIIRTRIPDDLRFKLEQAAKENRRSMASEIAIRLEESFSAPALAADLKEMIDRHSDRMLRELGERRAQLNALERQITESDARFRKREEQLELKISELRDKVEKQERSAQNRSGPDTQETGEKWKR